MEPTVFIVDDEPELRTVMDRLMASVGLRAEAYADGQSFLDAFDPESPGCLVLDVRMPGMSGLELHRRLLERGCLLPTIFLTSHGDVPMTVKAMQAGAIDFLEKPPGNQLLIDRVQSAIRQDAEEREKHGREAEIRRRFDGLTPREREVMELVVAGHSNKEVSARLHLAQSTVELYRGQVMSKMQAQNLPGLVRMGIVLGITSASSD